MGARWGLHSEASFRNALKGILERIPGIEVFNFTDFDRTGQVFGRPEQIELDIIIRNGLLFIIEIKSSMSRADVYLFERKAHFYEKHHNRQATNLIIISPMLDPRAHKVANELGILVYSYADNVPPELFNPPST